MKKLFGLFLFVAAFFVGANQVSAQYYPVSWSPAQNYYQPVGYSTGGQYYGGSYNVGYSTGYGPLNWYNPVVPAPRGVCLTGCGYPGAGMNWSPVLSRSGDYDSRPSGNFGGASLGGGCDAYGRCPSGYISTTATRNVWRNGDERVVRTRSSAEIFRYIY
jgi:hypothetical protein